MHAASARRRAWRCIAALASTLSLASSALAQWDVPTFERAVLRRRTVAEIDATTDTVRAGPNCAVQAAARGVVITAHREDPYVFLPKVVAQLPVRVEVQLETDDPVGSGQIYFTTEEAPEFAEARRVDFSISTDGSWTESWVLLPGSGILTGLRLDPGTGVGSVRLQNVQVEEVALHPLVIDGVRQLDGLLSVDVANFGPREIRYAIQLDPDERAQERSVEPGAIQRESWPQPKEPFSQRWIEVKTNEFDPVRRDVFVTRCDVPIPSPIVLCRGALRLEVDREGRGAYVFREGRLLAVIHPIVALASGIQVMRSAVQADGSILLEGAFGTRGRLDLTEDAIGFHLVTDGVLEGPVVRVLGHLEQGLLPGVEYLGSGESSSSRRDIDTSDHVRIHPSPASVTLSMMSVVTDRGSVTLSSTDPTTQVAFSTPDVVDGGPGARLSLTGWSTSGTLRFGPTFADGGRVDDAIASSLRDRPLPPLPTRPFSTERLRELARAAFAGPLRDEKGFGHCADAGWVRQPFADLHSTLWRLTGELPSTPLVPGGAHIEDPAIWFVSRRAQDYAEQCSQRAARTRQVQGENGGFRYAGRWREGHFEDTASGYVAAQALTLLHHAWLTGDEVSKAAGLRALAFLHRFRTPRGAQTWEVSLHTPDILAAAHATKAFARAYELTGDREHLDAARIWALRGIPFVYRHPGRFPAQLYATIAVFGATHRLAPNWIGLPVQWCGLVYAEALLDLAVHDDGPWRHLAAGIVGSAEWQLHADGPHVGCLPDSFDLASGQRRGPDINPTALLLLRERLEGRGPPLCVLREGPTVLASPFPISVTRREPDVIELQVDAPLSLGRHEVLVNGRATPIEGRQPLRVPLAPRAAPR